MRGLPAGATLLTIYQRMLPPPPPPTKPPRAPPEPGLRTSSRVGVKCPDIGVFGKIAYLPTLDLT